MSSWGLKYYPLCGFDCGQVLNKRHARKHGFGTADNLGAGPILATQHEALPASPRLSNYLIKWKLKSSNTKSN